VAIVHFGEGTTSRGDVHEPLNMAAVMKLPVIFICNNNGYAYSTPTDKQYAINDLAARGAAYGMPGVKVDGADVLAVYDTVGKAVMRARTGQGPGFIECKTFRMTGHSAHDAAEYVPEKLFAQWEKKDPIARLERVLSTRKVLSKNKFTIWIKKSARRWMMRLPMQRQVRFRKVRMQWKVSTAMLTAGGKVRLRSKSITYAATDLS